MSRRWEMQLTHRPRVSVGEGRASAISQQRERGAALLAASWAGKTGLRRGIAAQKEEREGKFLFIFFSKFPKQF